MKDHQKSYCPFPSSLKCSFCQRRNVRSDDCPCRKDKKKTSPPHLQPKVETAIYVRLYGKTVRTLLNPSIQETTICRAVANLVMANSKTKPRKLILRRSGNIGLVSCIQMTIRTRTHQAITIDGIIEDNLAEKIIILGMQAIQQFGFKFFVGGQEAKVRVEKCIELQTRERGDRSSRRTTDSRGDTRSRLHSSRKSEQSRGPGRSINHQAEERDEDEMSFLDEEEARMIREWN